MNWILTAELVRTIIFSMENQEQLSVFDMQTGTCVPIGSTGRKADDREANLEGRYQPLPCWTPSDGFYVMELFTGQLHNPAIREELRDALKQGKGVFKRFKDIVKKQPLIESQWHTFKEAYMKQRVSEWYKDLRSDYGLAQLCVEEEEPTALVQQDFLFAVSEGAALSHEFVRKFADVTAENAVYEAEAGGCNAAAREAVRCLLPPEQHWNAAVCITASDSDRICGVCVLMQGDGYTGIPLCRVLSEYRGLGIGKELLNQAAAYAEKQGQQLLVFSDVCVPQYFTAVLERHGFYRTGLLYTKKL